MPDNADLKGGDNAQAVASAQLRSYCERYERLDEEKKTIAEDMKEVMAEAKAVGFDTKMLKEMLKLRAMDKAERIEREAIRDTYAGALGLFD